MTQDILTGMRVFTTVVDLGSFAKAAEQLNLSRGMTLRHVSGVEARLGVRLLHRTTRHIALTEAGSDYYQRAVDILAAVDRAESVAGHSTLEPRGTVRVSAPMAFGTRTLGPVIQTYLKRFPQVQLDLDLTDRLVDLVEEGVDLAIRITRKIDPHLIARPLARAEMVVCASPRYLKLHGVPRTPEELVRHDVLTDTYSRMGTALRFSRGAKEVVIQVSGNCRTNSGELAARGAIAGLGIVCEPSFVVADALRSKRLIRLLPGWTADSFLIYAVYVNREFLPEKVRSLIDFLGVWFKKNAAWNDVARA